MTVLMVLSAVATVYTIYWMHRERRRGHSDQVLVAVGFFFFFAALFGDAVLKPGALFVLPAVVEVPLRILVLVLVLFFVYAFNQMREFTRENEEREHPQLVREGVYGYLRHPIYLGAITWVTLAFIFSPTFVRALMLPVSTVCFLLAARLEDQKNLEKFGKRFRRYEAEVPGFNAVKALHAWVNKK